MNQDKRNSAVGELMTMEKYKFTDRRLLAEICDDFLEEYEK